MQIRVAIENGDALAPTLRRESVLPIPDDGQLHIVLPVKHTRLLRKLMTAVDELVDAYASEFDIRPLMARLDTIIDECKKEA